MSLAIVVTGTDTNMGKTVFCAGLTRLLDAVYWKPVQAGLDGETDSDVVRRLSGLPKERILSEAWRLRAAASPHQSAALDGVVIDRWSLSLPNSPYPVIIEGAGGLLVPLTSQTLAIEVFARWRAPTVLCARTSLGTINHTLLSIEALRRRGIPLLGVAFIGDAQPENERIIATLGDTPVLGRPSCLETLTPSTLAEAFATAFQREMFLTREPLR